MIWGVDHHGNLVGYGERKMLMKRGVPARIKAKRTKAAVEARDRELAAVRDALEHERRRTEHIADLELVRQFKRQMRSFRVPDTQVLAASFIDEHGIMRTTNVPVRDLYRLIDALDRLLGK